MFEMLTGRVPFNGETTVAIAIKHIQEEMPSPKEFVPEIPSSVESIVLKCCQKSPDRRYQNMQELIADLKQSLMNPDEDFVVQNDPDLDGNTRTITEGEVAQIKRRTAYQEDYTEREDTMRLRTDTGSMYENEEEPEDGEDYDYNPKMEKVTTILAVGAGVVICVIVIILAVKVFGGMKDNKDGSSSPIQTEESSSSSEESSSEPEQIVYVEMPEIKGKLVEDVRNKLTELGLKSEVDYEESDVVEAGTVISADVTPGAQVPVGSTVTLTASAGAKGEVVPSVIGLTYEEANSTLLALGFTVTRTEAYSDSVEAGLVAIQTPGANNKLARGSNITLTVSLGVESSQVRVPNLMGLSEMDGTVEATEAKLQIGTVTRVYSDTYAEGLICYQSYSYGFYVEPGTVIDIRVSQGPEPKQTTYRCNASIEAPTAAEAPDYVTGSTVKLKLVADDGMVLLETSTSSFPYSTNYAPLTSSGGTLTMTYTVTTAPVFGTDENGNQIEVTPGTSEEKSFTRRIEFTPQ